MSGAAAWSLCTAGTCTESRVWECSPRWGSSNTIPACLRTKAARIFFLQFAHLSHLSSSSIPSLIFHPTAPTSRMCRIQHLLTANGVAGRGCVELDPASEQMHIAEGEELTYNYSMKWSGDPESHRVLIPMAMLA